MTALPIATPTVVRRAAVSELRAERRALAAILLLNALAAGAGLAGPRLLGRIIDVVKGGAGALSSVDGYAVVLLATTLAQILLARSALYASARFGERAAARFRERFLERVLALPATVVEHTTVGDLVTRGTTDVNTVASTLRNAVPEVFIAVTQALFLIVAVVILDPSLGACGLLCLAVGVVALRWYLRRAREGYLAEAAASAALAEVMTATVSGARTVEALGLQERRIEATEAAIAAARKTRLWTLHLRTVLLPAMDFSYTLPLVGVVLIGGMLYCRGGVSEGTAVAAALYMRQLASPLDAILLWVEQLQMSGASYARAEGVAAACGGIEHTERRPNGDAIEVAGASFAYVAGRDVLHDITISIRPGERLAIVGPSGSGKTTLGRLLAGIDRPRTGMVAVGGVPVCDLRPELLRAQVAMVTQEHHVFHCSLRDNLLIGRPDATDAEIRRALAAVGADWAHELPDGLDTEVGTGPHQIGDAQAQQLSLARIVLADPHTVILDEATALLDPSTTRRTELVLKSVLRGHSVVAIAHRLQTAHDADRVAVLDAGCIVELGSHDELIAQGGVYSALWGAWHGR